MREIKIRAVPPLIEDTLWFNLDETPYHVPCNVCGKFLGYTNVDISKGNICYKCSDTVTDYNKLECFICLHHVGEWNTDKRFDFICNDCIMTFKVMELSEFEEKNKRIKDEARNKDF